MLFPKEEEQMRPKVYVVNLSADEQAKLHQMLRGGTHQTRTLTRARILLHAHQGMKDAEIVTALGTSMSTVGRMRTQYATRGLDAALYEAPRPGGKPALDGAGEAYLVALACSDPPHGRGVWTMQLLADQLVTLGVVETISDETVRRTLKKGASNRGSTNSGVFRR